MRCDGPGVDERALAHTITGDKAPGLEIGFHEAVRASAAEVMNRGTGCNWMQARVRRLHNAPLNPAVVRGGIWLGQAENGYADPDLAIND